MEDTEIIDLYFARDQRAIAETGAKFGAYLIRVAKNVLENHEDAEECVNDTYISAWNAMPPHRPDILRVFLGKITRRISLNRLRARRAYKRGGGGAEVAIEELSEILRDSRDTEGTVEAEELTEAINLFLKSLSDRERGIFLRRYRYFDSVSRIASSLGLSEGTVKSSLHRTRKKLKNHLEKEGWL